MEKTTWYVFQMKDEAGNFYAYAAGIRNCNDLTGFAKEAFSMNACDSKKDAQRIAQAWNDQYVKNNTAAGFLTARWH